MEQMNERDTNFQNFLMAMFRICKYFSNPVEMVGVVVEAMNTVFEARAKGWSEAEMEQDSLRAYAQAKAEQRQRMS